jgi:hypothetical protein
MADKWLWSNGTGAFTWDGTATNKWSSSGSSFVQTTAPGSSDRVIISDAAASAGTALTITRTTTAALQGVLITRTNGSTTIAGTTAWTIGSAGIDATAPTVASGYSLAWENTGTITFNASCTLNLRGLATTSPMTITSTSVTVTLSSGGGTVRGFTFTGGALSLAAGVAFTCGTFTLSGTSSRSITFGTGSRIEVRPTATGTAIDCSAGAISFTGTPNLYFYTTRTLTAGFGSSAPFNVFVVGFTTPTTLAGNIGSLDTSGHTGVITITGTLNVAGSVVVCSDSAASFTGTGIIVFNGSADQTFTSYNQSLPWNVTVSKTSGTFFLGSALQTTGSFFHTGTQPVNQQGYALTVGGLTRDTVTSWTNGGGSLTVTGSYSENDLATYSDATTISMTGTSAKSVTAYGSSNLTIAQAGSGQLTLAPQAGTMTLANLRATVTGTVVAVLASTTLVLGALSLSNATLQSSVTGTRFNLSKSSGVVSVSNLAIRDCNATGGATWRAYLANGNTNVGNNAGWDFADPNPSYNLPGATVSLFTVSATVSQTYKLGRWITVYGPDDTIGNDVQVPLAIASIPLPFPSGDQAYFSGSGQTAAATAPAGSAGVGRTVQYALPGVSASAPDETLSYGAQVSGRVSTLIEVWYAWLDSSAPGVSYSYSYLGSTLASPPQGIVLADLAAVAVSGPISYFTRTYRYEPTDANGFASIPPVPVITARDLSRNTVQAPGGSIQVRYGYFGARTRAQRYFGTKTDAAMALGPQARLPW